MAKEIFLLVSALLIACTALHADIIELKNGREITGEIVHETEEAVIVSKQGGCLVCAIARERIRAIRESAPEEEQLQPEKARESSASGRISEEEKARKEDLEKYRLEKYKREVLAAKKARGRMKIKFSKGRFGIVDAMLNRKVKAALLVDTGASLVVISKKVAEELKIEDMDDKPLIPLVLADGRITSAVAITLDSVTVGNSKVKDVKAAVAEKPPGGGLDGVLGMSFLSYFHVKLDSKENCLVLEKY